MGLIPPRSTVPSTTRVDLHLHSRASTDTGSWFLSRAVMPESFVDPHVAYRVCKERGMDLVTLTDHNTVSGAMEIAHHPDVVVGVEITTWFPEDRVPLHVLAWGVDDAAWTDLDRARADVYELVAELERRDLPHALAHPLHRVGDELTADHLERCLLLFRMWEGRNGYRPPLGNDVAVRIAQSASAALLGRLAEKHGIVPRGAGPPALTGGSDDHSVLEAAATWTETPFAATPAALLDHLRAGRTTPKGRHGSPTALAHSIGTLFLTQLTTSGVLRIPEGLRGIVGELLKQDVPAAGDGGAGGGWGAGIADRIRADRAMVRSYRRIGRRPESADRSRERLRLVAGWLHEQALGAALDPDGFAMGNLPARGDALAGAAALAAPYLLASRWMRAERDHAQEFQDAWFGVPGARVNSGPVRAAVLTDTFDQLNGAAGTMRRLAAWSAGIPDAPVTVIAPAATASSAPGLIRLRSVADLPVPAYADPDWTLGVPSLLDVLDAVERSGADVVHAATPGPMGLAALAVARTLNLPFVASHHTELAEYAMHLTGDRLAAELTARAVGWFYSQARRVYVPTRATGAGLMDQGVHPSRLFIFGRGADLSAFGPGRGGWVARHRMGGRDATIVLYVGRISREKGLDVLADAFRRAAVRRPDLRLAIVGDGPYRRSLASALEGTPHRFMGSLRGPALAAAYAASDIFCLPSATETFGQVALEAAASGLPVIVSDRGGARESVEDGVTGLVVPAGDAAAFAEAIATLADRPGRRRAMGEAGREAAGRRPGWDEVFEGLLASYEQVLDRAAPPGPDPASAWRAGLDGAGAA
ncbi:MAG: glycosyltransferase [Thermoleophilia bacterium]